MVSGSAGDAFNLAITASGAWTLSESLDWLSVSAGTGNGNATVTVRTIRSNTNSVPREGTLTLSAPYATNQTITVSQQPSDELPRRLAHWTFENGGTDISGEGNHLTFQNGAAVSTDAAIGQGSLHLDGVNDLAVASGFRGVLGSRPRTDLGMDQNDRQRWRDRCLGNRYHLSESVFPASSRPMEQPEPCA